MESSVIAPRSTIARHETPRDLVVSPGFLVASFASILDPRRRQGRRYPLASLLALALVVIRSNCASVLAIA